MTDPAGTNTQVQYNDNGVFGASPNLAFDSTTSALSLLTGVFYQDFPSTSPTSGAGKILYDVVTNPPANGAGGSDADHYRLVVTSGVFTNGPPSQTSYSDNVFGIGWNLNNSFTPADPSKPCASYRIEDKYYQGGVFACEFHTAITTIQGNERRLITAFAPHNDSDAALSGVTLQANVQTQSDYLGNPCVSWNFNNGTIFLYKPLAFLASSNNTPVLRQANAAGSSYVALPYIDDAGNTVVSSAIATPVSGGNAAGPIFTTRGTNTSALTATAPGANAATLNLSCRDGTSQKAGSFSIDASGNVVFRQASSGGGMYFDNNNNLIFRNASAGFATMATMTTSALALKMPAVLPTYMAATLPSPTAALKGARAFISDATSPSFMSVAAGGGSTFAPVYCDGTGWFFG